MTTEIEGKLKQYGIKESLIGIIHHLNNRDIVDGTIHGGICINFIHESLDETGVVKTIPTNRQKVTINLSFITDVKA